MIEFFSSILSILLFLVAVVQCAESNSSPDSLFPDDPFAEYSSRPDITISIVGPEPDRDLDSLFPTTSQYDNEIETLLGDIGDKVGYLRDVLNGESIDEYGKKLENDILNGNLDKVTIKKLRKLCIYGIRRNNEWLLTAANSFNRKLEERKSFKDSWLIAMIRSFRCEKIVHTWNTLVQTIFVIQVDKFIKRLEEVVPVGYDLDVVNHLKSGSLLKDGNEKLFEAILKEWTQNVMGLWKSQPAARPAIKSHGKFWLGFVNFSEEIRHSFNILARSSMDPILEARYLIIRNFFESQIFGITKKDVKTWS